jgi:DNA mismatch repair protein MutL
MTAEEYKTFATAIKDAPQPKPAAAIMTAAKVERTAVQPLKETVILPDFATPKPVETSPIPQKPPVILPPIVPEEPEVEQVTLEMPKEIPWRMVGELYNSYIIVEQGDEAFLIDKHAAHERILFEKLKANQEAISAQTLLTPIPVRLSPEAAGELLANRELLDELGFEIDEFGDQTVVLRQIPMDLSPADASDAVETLAADLLNGRRERKDSIRDELLHTVACKAAIKAGWHSDEKELLALAEKVMANEDLKYCPHGRPICITLSKKQLEKQFKRS